LVSKGNGEGGVKYAKKKNRRKEGVLGMTSSKEKKGRGVMDADN